MYDHPSVLAQVRISPESFKRFSESPVQLTFFDDYQAWLATKDWEGKQDDHAAARIIAEAGQGNRDFCRQEMEEFCIQDYEPESQTFTLFWFEYKINYDELIRFLNSFRQIADFKDLSSDDFLAIGYENWLADESELVLKIQQGSSSILLPSDRSAEKILEKAGMLAESLVENLSSRFGGS